MLMINQTLVLIKPDGLKKSLTGNILTRLSETKLEIVGAKIARASRELAEKHYSHLKDEPFFDELIKYIMGELHQRRKVMAMVYWGEGAINKVKKLSVPKILLSGNHQQIGDWRHKNSK